MSDSSPKLPLGTVPLVRPIGWLRRWFPYVIYALALVPMTVRTRQGPNVESRYMTIEAIVEKGTLAVDKTPLWQIARPVDLVVFGNHFYSDKPPVLSVLATPIYALMMALGARFTGSQIQYVFDNLALTWFTSGIASALTLVWLRKMFQTLPIPPLLADALALGFGYTSQIFAYAVTFNNHSVAACLITGAMMFTLLEAPGRHAARSRFLAGLLIGLASTIDLPSGGVMLVSLALIHSARARSIPWSFLAGAVGPLAFHSWLQSLVTGTPLPVEMYPQAFEYPGSYWTKPEMIWREHGPRWRFGLELLLGPQGWLTVTPVVIFGLVGLGLVIARTGDALRPMACAVACSVVVLVGYYTWGVRRTDFGGESFGTRHLLAITPACYFFAVVALERLRGKFAPVLFVLAISIGFVYALAGEKHPWRTIEQARKTDPWLERVQKLVIYPRNQNLENPGAAR